MSLIDDALQRAQATLTGQEQERQAAGSPTANPPGAEPRVRLGPLRPSRSGWLTAIALAGVGAGVLGLTWLTNVMWMHRLTVVTTPVLPPSPPTAAAVSTSLSLLPISPEPPASSVAPRPAPLSHAAAAPPRPRVQRAASLPHRVKLQGVIHGSGEPYAIINDMIVQVGDSVEGATLVSVAKDSVHLRWRDQELTVYLDR